MGDGELGHGEGYGTGIEALETPWRIPEGRPGVWDVRRDGELGVGGGGGVMGHRQIARKVEDFFFRKE